MSAGSRPLVDTHAHLDDHQFALDVDAVIDRAIGSGIQRILNIGYRPESWRSSRLLAERYPVVAYSLGLHPHHADEWTPALEAELLALLREGDATALGETGIDLVRSTTSVKVQQRVFARQLEIAADLGLPVVIHHREAERELTDVLAQTDSTLVCILHSFDGSDELALFALERDWYFGVGGLMTKKPNLQRVVSRLPIDNLLLETDAPYLVPKGAGIRRNEPAFVQHSAEFLAGLRNQTVDSIAIQTSNNAARVFGSRFLDAQSLPVREDLECPAAASS